MVRRLQCRHPLRMNFQFMCPEVKKFSLRFNDGGLVDDLIQPFSFFLGNECVTCTFSVELLR